MGTKPMSPCARCACHTKIRAESVSSYIINPRPNANFMLDFPDAFETKNKKPARAPKPYRHAGGHRSDTPWLPLLAYERKRRRIFRRLHGVSKLRIFQ